MRLLIAYLAVFVAAAIPWLEVLFVVPAGVLAGLPVVPTVVVASIGNLATLVPVVYAGDRLRRWWERRQARRAERSGPADAPEVEMSADAELSADGELRSDPDGLAAPDRRRDRGKRALQALKRYGLPGVGLLAPLLTGAHVAAVVAVATGADRTRTLFWMAIGIVLWAVVSGVLAVVGIELLFDPDQLPDLGLAVN